MDEAHRKLLNFKPGFNFRLEPNFSANCMCVVIYYIEDDFEQYVAWNIDEKEPEKLRMFEALIDYANKRFVPALHEIIYKREVYLEKQRDATESN